MEDQFQIVKTWRGYILVSSCLLPSSSAERARIYPDYFDNDAPTARDATHVSQDQVAQEGYRQLPGPNSYRCGYITQGPCATELRYEKGLLGTSSESRLAAASERFVEPDKMGKSVPTTNDETVHLPDSLQTAVPSWKRGSRDWEHGSRTSSESTSSTSPVPFPTATQPAPATPLGNRECCTNKNRSEPVPAPPSASSPSDFGTPRLEVRPKRRLSNDSIEEASALES